MNAQLLLRSYSSRRLALTSLSTTVNIHKDTISRLLPFTSREFHSIRHPACKSLLLPQLELYNTTYRYYSRSHGTLEEEDETMEQRTLRLKLSVEDIKRADRITWVGIWLNVVLSGLKGVAGVTFHSSGLLADAVHSMSDLISDFVTLVTLKYCARPPDTLQPYGYGKFETMGALSVSLLLVGGSMGILVHSLDSLLVLIEPLSAVESVVNSVHSHGHGMVMHPAALIIAALSVTAKEALYRTTIGIGKRVHSSVLIANAWHHRSDAVTSLVAMGGIGLSLAGFPYFDPLAGIAVGGIILKMGTEIGWKSIKELCDAKLSDKIIRSLEKAVDGVIGSSDGEVLGVRQLRSRKVGRNIHVDLTLVVGDASGVHHAVEWKQKAKSAIKYKIPRVNDIVVEITTPEQLAAVAAAEAKEKHEHVSQSQL